MIVRATISILMIFTLTGARVSASPDAVTAAKKMLERLTGTKVPGDSAPLRQMADLIEQGQLRSAAFVAVQQPGFYNVTVKQMGLKMSTREESLRTPLNDFTAFLIGAVRDDLDARLLLTGNFYYRGDSALVPAGLTVRSDVLNDIVKSNNHYADLDRPDIDLTKVLRRFDNQPVFSRRDNALANNPDPAGVLTSRAFLGAHADAGTNRRLVEFSFREFMCVPIEKWADVTAPDNRIGRDIDRFPGGDHLRFQTKCKGCHTQMDGFRGAFAKTDFRDGMILRGPLENPNANGLKNGVVDKLNRNNTVFKDGYVTTDSTWVNNARGPANEGFFGWRGSNVKNGADVQALGLLISNSKRFSECMAQRVFETVCRQPIVASQQTAYMKDMAQRFENGKYVLRNLFVDVALSPECGL